MINKRYEIRCDGGRKFQRRYCSAALTGGLKAAVKAEAKAAGWKTTRSFLWGPTHICPACQAAARGEQTVDGHANTALKVVGES